MSTIIVPGALASSVSAPADGQVLVYDGPSSSFKNQTALAAGAILDTNTDLALFSTVVDDTGNESAGSNPPANASDGNDSSLWSSSASATAFLSYDLAYPRAVTQVFINRDAGHSGSSGSIQYSDDNATWTTARSFSGLGGGGATFNIGNNGAHRYWRANFTNTGGDHTNIFTFKMFGLIPSNAHISSNNIVLGVTSTDDGTGAGNSSHAFDGAYTNVWSSNGTSTGLGDHIAIDFGAGIGYNLARVFISEDSTHQAATHTVAWSDDNVTYTNVATMAIIPGGGSGSQAGGNYLTNTLPTDAPHRYWRFYFQSPSGQHTNVWQIRAYAWEGADSVWTAPTLGNSWANVAGWEPAGFRKDANGFVHLRGRIAGGSTGTVPFTLPVGYRPGAGTGLFPFTSTDGSDATLTAGYATITTAGVVTLTLSGARASLDGISFLAEN